MSALAVGMALAGGWLFVRYTSDHAPDPHLIAVAPFDIPDEPGDLAPWRVGLATRLTERLSGNGGLRAVPQAEVAEMWRARATPIIAAVELARRTAAGLALYGRVDRGSGDTLVIRVAVIDAVSTRGLFELATTVPPPGDIALAADTLFALVRARLAALNSPAPPG
jgi:hypothetical protein